METPNTNIPPETAQPVPPASTPAPEAATPTSSEPKHNVAMAVLAYIGPLIIISYLTAKDDPFVKYHIKQGFVLFVVEVALWVIGSALYIPGFWMIFKLVHIATVVLAIIGIVNAVKGEEKELPFVGKFAQHFKI